MESPALADRIDAILPQTQCARCGYAACRPYADAVAAGAAPIDRCPPGGTATIAALARLTGHPATPLDPAYGREGPLTLARIDEGTCIGCTLCLDACPVDAIIGAPKRMHAVLAALCTGCELCVPPCPVDCIAFEPAERTWTPADAAAARARFNARNARIAGAERLSDRGAQPAASSAAARKPAIDAATARARARRAAAAR